MKYFLDTEFHEFKKKPFIGKPIDTIELISIGIVSEDGREYYAISKDFDLKDAWNNEWLRNNVLKNLFNNEKFKHYTEPYSFIQLKKLINHFGKTNKQIAEEAKEFCKPQIAEGDSINGVTKWYNPEFYGYYSDYDWVVFCWLFGRMIDLPKGFPMYCIDLKQELDKYVMVKCMINNFENSKNTSYVEEVLQKVKNYPDYPKQTNEHNALSDAKWNFELYKFLRPL
jgi:hypothetical protein